MPSILWGDDEGADVCLPFNGNCSLSGVQLINAGAADDDVALAFDHIGSDDDTVLYYPMNEATWPGAGTVSDGSGNARHGNPRRGASPTTDALDRCGGFPASSVSSVYSPSLPAMDACTLEFWLKILSLPPGTRRVLTSGLVSILQNQVSLLIYQATGNQHYIPYVMNTWQHVALVVDKPNNKKIAYINGTRVVNGVTSTGLLAAGVLTIAAQADGGWTADMLADDFRVSDVARFTEASFTPRRWRKSAPQNGGVQPYVQVSGAGLAGMLPTAVSWTAQTGSAYGRVHSVWVNDVTGGWTQVGGAYPTSPVSVAGLVLASNDAVRVALEPEAVSGIQNASPTLQDVTLTYTAPASGRLWLPARMRAGRYA